MDLKAFVKSKKFVWAVSILCSLIVLLLVFQAGMFVGVRKARFSYGWGDNYHRAFGGPRGGVLQDFEGRELIDGHGISGIVLRVENNTVVLKSVDGRERIITIEPTTTLKRGTSTIGVGDLHTDNRIVVIGNPSSDGTLMAQLVRVFDGSPPPPPLLFFRQLQP